MSGMDTEYDIIVLGTGFKECILSGLMSQLGHKVLHIDKNSYYGAECASLNLEQLYTKFNQSVSSIPATLGKSRDYCIDLTPKFIMACGSLVKILLKTRVTKYLEFRSVDSNYILSSDKKIYKVPATSTEALNSSLLGLFQKRRFRNFLQWVNQLDSKQPSTYSECDIKQTSSAVFKYWSLGEDTIDFIGHAIALEETSNYLHLPFIDILHKIKLYFYSVQCYGKSPFIYPLYGLAGLPEGFSRLSAINGGTYMLNKNITDMKYDEKGNIQGVYLDGETELIKCKKIISDPNYFANTNKVRHTNTIIRAYCILSHSIPNTHDADSCQIIIPYNQIRNRKNDMYIFVVSYHHKVVADGKYLAVISTTMESNDARTEIQPALDLLGKIDQLFISTDKFYDSVNNCHTDNCYITNSYDSTSHFESATQDVIDMYQKLTGNPLDLNVSANPEDLENAE